MRLFSAPDTQHEDSTYLTLARPVLSETHLGKPLFNPGHFTVSQFQGVCQYSASWYW